MSSRESAGRGPSAKRPATSKSQRPRPTTATLRPEAQPEADPAARQTALTARAAILLLALAAVAVAVALPLKIWLGQRNDISSLTAQTRAASVQVGQLSAQDKRWQDSGYVEAQARTRLHFVLPGQKTYIVLGDSGKKKAAAAAAAKPAAATSSWYSAFWQSEKTAGQTTASK